MIAGCNGAGKTPFASEFLLKELGCSNFLNADYLALGLPPLSPEMAAMKAGRLLLAEFKSLVACKETFAVERTLSGFTYLRILREAQRRGFRIYLHFLWLPKPAIAIARERERVKKGGHNVPVADIRRRFARGLRHFVRDYAPLVDRWALWDNLMNPPELRADSRTCTPAELQHMVLPAMSAGRKTKSQDAILAPARRALRRAARRVRMENLRLGLPLIAVEHGKPVAKPA